MQKPLDLRDALNCLREMEKRNYPEHIETKVGMIVENFATNLYAISQIIPDERDRIVLFKQEKSRGLLTVEFPMTAEQIAKQKSEGSFLLTYGTVVNVPEKYIAEIILE